VKAEDSPFHELTRTILFSASCAGGGSIAGLSPLSEDVPPELLTQDLPQDSIVELIMVTVIFLPINQFLKFLS
jgi:hypothetical protein